MAITHSTALRAALAAAVNTYVNTGGGTAVLRLLDASADVLVSFPLLNPAYTLNGAQIILNGVTIQATAGLTGTAISFEVHAADGSLAYAGSVSLTSGGGDLQLSSVGIISGQRYSLTEHSYSAPV